MARVFVSYASEDLQLAREVRGWLDDDRHDVFLAGDIAAGDQWEPKLYAEVRRADAMVCVVTAHYLASTWCAAEVGAARSGSTPLLPLLAEPDISHPQLAGIQHTDWTADSRAARDAVVKKLRRLDAGGGWGWPDGRSPFPGLRSFETEEHRAFFGRDSEVDQLAMRLRSSAEGATEGISLIVGPSGCGKSSLVRAGLVPKMANEPDWWTVPPMRPGTDPVGELAYMLALAAKTLRPGWTVDWVIQQLEANGLTRLARDLLVAADAQHLLLVVDQFDELITQTDLDNRTRFATLLGSASAGRVRVVGTLRAELLAQLLSDSALAILNIDTCLLWPLPSASLKTVIEAPARLAGIAVADDLVNQLVADTASGEALPLLAFALAELAAGVSRGDQLSRDLYDELGGVPGALAHQADEALREALRVSGRTRDEVIDGLLLLVTVDEQGNATRREVPRHELPEPVAGDLKHFVDRRLLSTSSRDSDGVVISVTHEAFFSAWEPLREAIGKNEPALRTRQRAEQAAMEWAGNGRPAKRLWVGDQLAVAIADLGGRSHVGGASTSGQDRSRLLGWLRQIDVTPQIGVSPAAREFLKASISRDRYLRLRLSLGLAVLLAIAVVAAVVAFWLWNAAREQQRIATARQLISQADALRDTDPRTALLLGIAAERISPGSEAQAGLVNILTATRYAGTFDSRAQPRNSVAVSPDRHTLAAGGSDGRVTVWDLADFARLRRSLAGQVGPLSSVAFSGDGHILAAGGADGSVVLWDLTDPTGNRRVLPGQAVQLRSVVFSGDGRTLAAGGADGSVVLWDLTDPTGNRPVLAGGIGPIFSVAFSGDGRTLAAGGVDGVVVWDPADPARTRRVLEGHRASVNSVALTRDGRGLAAASDDGTALLWQLTGVTQPQPLDPTGHTGKMTAVAFAPDGHTLATASDDGTTLLWRLDDITQPVMLQPALPGHSGRVTAVAFVPDGNSLVTASADGAVIRWDLINMARPRVIGQISSGEPGPVKSVMFAAQGNALTTISSNSTEIDWDLSDPGRPRRGPSRPHGNGLMKYLTVASDGTLAVRPGGGGSVILWDLTDRATPRPLGQPLTGHRDVVIAAAFSRTGRTLAVASDDGSVILWDLTDRTTHRQLGQPLTGHRGPVVSVAFSGDDRTLATAGDDGTVILWDLTDRATPRPLGQPLTGRAGSVTSVALALDGRLLATGGSDSTVFLWDLTNLQQLRDHAIERACAVTGRGLDGDEWARYVQGLPYQSTC